MEHQETLWTLLTDPNHWALELIIMAIFDGLIGLCLWPWVKRSLLHHKSDDQKIDDLEKKVRRLYRRPIMKRNR